MVKRFSVMVLAALMAISASACSAQPTGSGSGTSDEALSGDVAIDGSGTVYPLMANLAEEYMTGVQPDVSVEVGRAGTSAGFKKFIAGETDFSDASRAIKDEEKTALNEAGILYGTDILEIKIAYDGLTIVINKGNTWATEMTVSEILGMFTSGTWRTDDKVFWSDIRSSWPAQAISFYGPNENHGTYEFFHETLLKKADLVKTIDLQQEYSTLVDLVANDVNAIAFFGYGYYAGNTDKLTAVKVDFGAGGVEPSLETIGEELGYAGFTRAVYTYLNLRKAESDPAVLDFAKYIVSDQGALRFAGANGFAPLPAADYAAYQAMAALEAIG